jgi:thiamine-monophosphate kinase
MARRTERQMVAVLRERFRPAATVGANQPNAAASIHVGIGDDAAVVAGSEAAWVSSVDAAVDGVHFDLAFLDYADVGYRAFQAAASDLGAMGAIPVGALSALILPRTLSDAALDRLTEGQAEASRELGCPILGGNISRGRELSVTTTVLGRCPDAPLCRGGARAGDQVWLVGSVGLAGAGLACLRLGLGADGVGSNARGTALRAAASEASRRAVERCIGAWRRPRALLEPGRDLAGIASACIDVSDGLATDAAQLARASGVRLVIERELLRAALDQELLGASHVLKRSALHFALYGGEDYALLATGPSGQRPTFARPIGVVTRGQGARLATPEGERPLSRGFDHFGR